MAHKAPAGGRRAHLPVGGSAADIVPPSRSMFSVSSSGLLARVRRGHFSPAPPPCASPPTRPCSHPRDSYKKPRQLGPGQPRKALPASPARLPSLGSCLPQPSVIGRPLFLSLFTPDDSTPAPGPRRPCEGPGLWWPQRDLGLGPGHPGAPPAEPGFTATLFGEPDRTPRAPPTATWGPSQVGEQYQGKSRHRRWLCFPLERILCLA